MVFPHADRNVINGDSIVVTIRTVDFEHDLEARNGYFAERSKMTVYYLFYDRDDEGTRLVARLDGMTFSGEQAESMERFLRAQGWPEIEPDRILHGSRSWAARVDVEPAGEDIDKPAK